MVIKNQNRKILPKAQNKNKKWYLEIKLRKPLKLRSKKLQKVKKILKIVIKSAKK